MERDIGDHIERVAPVAKQRSPPLPAIDIDNIDAAVGAVEVAADFSPPRRLGGFKHPEGPLRWPCMEHECAEVRDQRRELVARVVSCGALVLVRHRYTSFPELLDCCYH